MVLKNINQFFFFKWNQIVSGLYSPHQSSLIIKLQALFLLQKATHRSSRNHRGEARGARTTWSSRWTKKRPEEEQTRSQGRHVQEPLSVRTTRRHRICSETNRAGMRLIWLILQQSPENYAWRASPRWTNFYARPFGVYGLQNVTTKLHCCYMLLRFWNRNLQFDHFYWHFVRKVEEWNTLAHAHECLHIWRTIFGRSLALHINTAGTVWMHFSCFPTPCTTHFSHCKQPLTSPEFSKKAVWTESDVWPACESPWANIWTSSAYRQWHI